MAGVDVDWPTFVPYAEQIGFGMVAGFAVGYALKKLGKLAAIALGLVFILIQTLAYQGFLTVNWGEVQARVDPLFERDSLASAWEGLLGVLTYNLAFAGAFVPGLVIGFRRG
jgi:uncharacterized membrane protein (Fun14 family)